MKICELIIKAIEIEAQNKPNEKIVIGNKIFTYAEFAKILKQKSEKEIVNAFLNQAEKLFKCNKAFKAKILELAKR